MKGRVHVVSFSGGRTSAYLVWRMLDFARRNGWIVFVVFMDTGAEHPETYKFIRKCVLHWNFNLICLKVKINPVLGQGNIYQEMSIDDIGYNLNVWMDMIKKYGVPYVAGGEFCTDRMKTTPFKKFCEDKFGKGNYKTWLGMRADEPKRLRKKGGVGYLADIDDAEKEDILEWWKNQKFDLEVEEHLGNCVFCIKKSIGKVGLATLDEPDMAYSFNEMLESPAVRVVESRIGPHLIMYRGKNTLKQIIKTYKDMDRDELFSTLKFSKRDSGGCSGSCEINIDQLDLI